MNCIRPGADPGAQLPPPRWSYEAALLVWRALESTAAVASPARLAADPAAGSPTSPGNGPFNRYAHDAAGSPHKLPGAAPVLLRASVLGWQVRRGGVAVFTVQLAYRSTAAGDTELTWLLRRRFSDFARLHTWLARTATGFDLAPLPPKHPFAHQDDIFLRTRAAALQAYLRANISRVVSAISYGAFDDPLAVFLEASRAVVPGAAAVSPRKRTAAPPAPPSRGAAGAGADAAQPFVPLEPPEEEEPPPSRGGGDDQPAVLPLERTLADLREAGVDTTQGKWSMFGNPAASRQAKAFGSNSVGEAQRLFSPKVFSSKTPQSGRRPSGGKKGTGVVRRRLDMGDDAAGSAAADESGSDCDGGGASGPGPVALDAHGFSIGGTATSPPQSGMDALFDSICEAVLDASVVELLVRAEFEEELENENDDFTGEQWLETLDDELRALEAVVGDDAGHDDADDATIEELLRMSGVAAVTGKTRRASVRANRRLSLTEQGNWSPGRRSSTSTPPPWEEEAAGPPPMMGTLGGADV